MRKANQSSECRVVSQTFHERDSGADTSARVSDMEFVRLVIIKVARDNSRLRLHRLDINTAFVEAYRLQNRPQNVPPV